MIRNKKIALVSGAIFLIIVVCGLAIPIDSDGVYTCKGNTSRLRFDIVLGHKKSFDELDQQAVQQGVANRDCAFVDGHLYLL